MILSQNSIQLAKQSIMLAEEYAQIQHDRPYIYEIKSGNKQIVCFGVSHSCDPDNLVWAQLKHKFEQPKPDLVLVEGLENLSQRKSEIISAIKDYDEIQVISRMGEPGLTIKLAIDDGVDFDSPEPVFAEEIRYLEKQSFSHEAIFAYYIFRLVPQWLKRAKTEDFKKYIGRWATGIKQVTQWDLFDYSYENIERIAKNFWDEGINLNDPKYYHDKIDPIPWLKKKDEQTEVNLVSRASVRFRDQNIIEQIAKYLQTHDCIFIVYGSSHLVMLEPGIRKLMSELI